MESNCDNCRTLNLQPALHQIYDPPEKYDLFHSFIPKILILILIHFGFGNLVRETQNLIPERIRNHGTLRTRNHEGNIFLLIELHPTDK